MNATDAFRNNLKTLIDSGETTIVDLKEKTGISRSTIYGWITGETAPNLEQVQRVSKAVHRTASTLLKGEALEPLPKPAPGEHELRMACVTALLKIDVNHLSGVLEFLEKMTPEHVNTTAKGKQRGSS